MNCVHCNIEIPEARIKALPKTKTCVRCSDTARVAGHPLITGKDTYSDLQIVDQETAEKLFNQQSRRSRVEDHRR